MLRAMRTTLNLAPEAIAKVRLLATQRQETLGAVASELILKALQPKDGPRVRNGVPIFNERVPGAEPLPATTLDLVNRLRDEEP